MNDMLTSSRHRCAPSRRLVGLIALGVACSFVEASGLLPAGPELRLAYLDPGSGSFMIQALVAALAGIAVTVRTYWSKIRVFFGAAPPEPEDDDPTIDTSNE